MHRNHLPNTTKVTYKKKLNHRYLHFRRGSPKKTGPNQQSNNKARKDTISDLTDNTANDKKQPIALKSKAVRKNRIMETIMGSVTDAIEKQGAAKSVWKKEKLEATKAWKAEELMLQKRQLVMQQKRSRAEVEVLNRKSEVEIRKMNHEAALLEEQKKSVKQDRLKKLLLDRKELRDLGVSDSEIDLLLPLQL